MSDFRKLTGGGLTHWGESFDLSKGSFGANVGNELTIQISAYLEKFNDPRIWNKYVSGTGGVAYSSGEAVLSTGTTIYSYASLLTVSGSAYQPGTGLRALWTARFPDGDLANGFAVAGPYHAEAGFGVGYGSGDGFGIMHRYGRRLEVRALTINVAASGSETATITLNGTAHAVPVTAGTTAHNAQEIADFGAYADSGGLVTYDVYSVGNVVYFIRQTHGTVAGAFTLTSTGTLSSSSFAQFQAGATGNQDWYLQADWNIDPCDGGGLSGATIDPTVGNIWCMTTGWLGYQGPVFWVNDPTLRRMIPVHHIPWGGTAVATKPTIADPRLPMAYSVASLGSTTDYRIAGASCMMALEGKAATQQGPRWTEFARNAAVGVTETPILSVMCSPLDFRHNRINRRRLSIEALDISNVGAKDVRIRVYVGKQSNLTGCNFAIQDVDSQVLVDTSSTAVTGTLDQIAGFPLGAGNDASGPLHSEELILQRGQVLIITAQTNASTTEISLELNGHEDI